VRPSPRALQYLQTHLRYPRPRHRCCFIAIAARTGEWTSTGMRWAPASLWRRVARIQFCPRRIKLSWSISRRSGAPPHDAAPGNAYATDPSFVYSGVSVYIERDVIADLAVSPVHCVSIFTIVYFRCCKHAATCISQICDVPV